LFLFLLNQLNVMRPFLLVRVSCLNDVVGYDL
jgi:hypothetical protein